MTDVEALINQSLAQRDTAAQRKANEAKALEGLTSKYGAEGIAEALKKTMVETGMGKEDMDLMAATHPDAFLRLMSAPDVGKLTPQVNPVNSSGLDLGNSSSRNKAYYRAMYKTDYNAWKSLATQTQMLKDKQSLADKW